MTSRWSFENRVSACDSAGRGGGRLRSSAWSAGAVWRPICWPSNRGRRRADLNRGPTDYESVALPLSYVGFGEAGAGGADLTRRRGIIVSRGRSRCAGGSDPAPRRRRAGHRQRGHRRGRAAGEARRHGARRARATRRLSKPRQRGQSGCQSRLSPPQRAQTRADRAAPSCGAREPAAGGAVDRCARLPRARPSAGRRAGVGGAVVLAAAGRREMAPRLAPEPRRRTPPRRRAIWLST